MIDHKDWSDETLVSYHESIAMGFQAHVMTKDKLFDARKAVLDRFAGLRQQLTGRTMHCGMCETYARQRDELRDAMAEFVEWRLGQIAKQNKPCKE